jgi:hypothetical protein
VVGREPAPNVCQVVAFAEGDHQFDAHFLCRQAVGDDDAEPLEVLAAARRASASMSATSANCGARSTSSPADAAARTAPD